MLAKLDPREVEALLLEQTVGRIGVRGDDQVYVFPVCYGFDGEYIYVQSSEGLKVRLMRAHLTVCFEVEEIRGPSRWASVMAHGSFEELTAERDRDRAFATILAQAGPRPPASLAPYLQGPEAMVVFRIRIAAVTGRCEDEQPVPLPARP
jgi:nitroimidazol reductase NimA-like FMN-containing flavoprotein (pyridoxamine 5'-phosphate oxidase superfamily)